MSKKKASARWKTVTRSIVWLTVRAHQVLVKCNTRTGPWFTILSKGSWASRGCCCQQSYRLYFLSSRWLTHTLTHTHTTETALSKETLATLSQPHNHPWFSHRETIAPNGCLMRLKDCAHQFVSIFVTNCAVHLRQRRAVWRHSLSFWMVLFALSVKFHGNESGNCRGKQQWRSHRCLQQHLIRAKGQQGSSDTPGVKSSHWLRVIFSHWFQTFLPHL